MRDETQQYIERVIATIREKYPHEYNYPKSSWIVVGSYATDSHHDDSDLDLLYISKEVVDVSRKKEQILGTVTSICNVPTAFLIDDGEDQKYGGYFSAKCLNPHKILESDPHIEQCIKKSAGQFMGPLASFIGHSANKSTFNADEITAHVFMAFMSLHAGYISYFLSYFALPHFSEIWEKLRGKTINSLITSNQIEPIGNDLFRYKTHLDSYEEYHFSRLKAGSRHWSFGTFLRGSDFQFQDDYYSNAFLKQKRIDPKGENMRKMRQFFQKITDLPEIII